jgi:two-component system, sensor histidine kinase and response regulator
VTNRLRPARPLTTESSTVAAAPGSADASVVVLIVDDNPAKRLSLKAALAPLGYSIVEADSGRAALRRLMVQDFAVILLDVLMPTMDGFETAALIRQRRQSEMTPIIFITAYTSDDLVVSDRWVDGAVDFIFSPVPPDELRAKVSVFANLFLRAAALAAEAREVQITADQLRLLTDAAPIGIFQTDRRNRYVYTNPRWTEITGIGSDEATGLAWDNIIGVERPDDPALPGTGPGVEQELSQRFELRPPDGTSRIALVTSKAIPGLGGGIVGWVGTLADVTVEARAETAMADAWARATEASRLKSDFLANMSHEIRTPMNGVIGMTDLLLETDLDARQRDYAQTVRNSGTALLAIINDILDFSKVEAGKLEVETIEFSLCTVIEDVVDLLSGPAQVKGLELIAIIEGAIPAVVRGDPGRVRQVLTNLIGNAIKFTRAGEIVVRVAEAGAKGLDTVVRFEVSDTGDGIATDKLASIFEPFTQADTSTSRRYGGTGLGLAISAQLVALMGGQCGVSSKLGTGSAFWFTITVQADTPAAGLGPVGPDVRLAGQAALIVDSNATQRAMLSGYLTGWGMTVTAVGSGPEAEDALHHAASAGSPFAVALVDRSLLASSSQQLRDAFADPALATRLVVMTRISEERDIDDVVAPAGSPAVRKPIRRAPLRRCLEAALGGSPEATPPEVAGQQRSAPGDANIGALLLVAEDNVVNQNAVGGPVVPTAPSPLRVLLVEDNLVNQKVALAMLGRFGYQADVAGNGIEALAAVHAAPYDLVFMDVQMPEMDGIEATRAIRSNLSAQSQPTIIAMTANATNADRRLCLNAGMDHFLSKPVRIKDLAAMLANYRPSHETAAAFELDAAADPGYSVQQPMSVDPASAIGLTGDPAVYDPAPLDALVAYLGENGEAVRLDLIETYLHDVDNRLTALTTASHDANGEALAFTAHALKSASAELGLFALSSAAKSIETAFRTAPQHFDVASEAARLMGECHRATTALRATIKTRG